MITGVLMFNAIPRGGAVQAIATIPELFWELSLSIYCVVKGFGLSSPHPPDRDTARVGVGVARSLRPHSLVNHKETESDPDRVDRASR
jgi:hypothetical protein